MVEEMNVTLYEELSMNAHPAIKTQFYDGWVMRFANGYTNRSNSVIPLYPSRIGLEEKIAYCEKIYASQGLPAVFKLTEYSPPGLDETLEANGYETVTPTDLMINRLVYGSAEINEYPSDGVDTIDSSFRGSTKFNNNGGLKIIVSPSITERWRENFFRLTGLTDNLKMQTAAIIQSNIQNKVFTVSLTENEKVIACGLCVVEREYAGLFDIHVDAAYRRQGYGYDICASLLNAAAKEGAVVGYLQVLNDNAAAQSLYKKLGFEFCYRYWYRVKQI